MNKLKGLCKYCKYSYRYYGDGKNVTKIQCVQRNGTIKHIPKECKWFSPKDTNRRDASLLI